MPSKSKSQQRLFGAAIAAKKGKPTFPLAQKLAGQMTGPQLKDFASGPINKPVQQKKNKSAPSYL